MGIDVENILDGDDDKPKKVNSGRKGKRTENELCKVLNKRFLKVFQKHPDWGRFSRTMGSGNRWGQRVHLSKAAKETFSADIACPTNFIWVIESKGGYNDIDVFTAISGKNSEIDDFLRQVTDDSERTGKKPLLVWKKDRKPRTAWVKTIDIPEKHINKFKHRLIYGEWSAVSFDTFINLPDPLFFSCC